MSPGTVTCNRPESKAAERVAAIRRDAVLPADIVPPARAAAFERRVLLTGATGFLGRHVLRELLERGLEVVCLIRGDVDARLEKTLLDGRVARSLWSQATAVRGDTSQERLGMCESYERLAREIDAVYHCAAEVSWVKSYALLRRTNVMAALEAIRFACAARTKPITFVSSLAVCFARGERIEVDESTDMAPWLDAMPLGYAQSKCVAESLMRQAAARGVPVTIARPGLLAGDTVTGKSNPGDVLSALLEGCVAQGMALDIDWQVDSIPVDYAARAIVELARSRRAPLEVHHVRHGRPRHWRELVLWLNLFGYPVRLIPVPEWNARVFANGKGGALSSYRRFFMGAGGSGFRPFEAYISDPQAAISCERSVARLRALGVDEPALDTPLLRRYVDHYARIGALPPHVWITQGAGDEPDAGLQGAVAESLGGGTAPNLRWEPLPFDASAGILNEIASIRLGTDVGMRRYRVARGERDSVDIIVKAKAHDSMMHAIVAEVAAMCDPELGEGVRAFPDALGLRRSHLREPALYLGAPAPVARHMPRCYGINADAARGRWSVAMEHLGGAEFKPGWLWEARDVEGAVEAAASIHSAWYAQADALRAHPWIAPEIAPAQARAMSRLWRSLAAHASPLFGARVNALQRRFIDEVDAWWGELAAMPRTLIHNDFNSRNLAFRGAGAARRACAFDWELARIGVPQHDLAELLCFTFPRDAGRSDLERWLELHRAQLAFNARAVIDPRLWRRGFLLALQHLLVERLPLYTLVHRFKVQPFLPGVVRNWARLYDLAVGLESQRRAA